MSTKEALGAVIEAITTAIERKWNEMTILFPAVGDLPLPPPADLEAEMTIIGECILKGELFPKWFKPEHCYRPFH
jgi:hypothetical protein